jgi:hypothetical protein
LLQSDGGGGGAETISTLSTVHTRSILARESEREEHRSSVNKIRKKVHTSSRVRESGGGGGDRSASSWLVG